MQSTSARDVTDGNPPSKRQKQQHVQPSRSSRSEKKERARQNKARKWEAKEEAKEKAKRKEALDAAARAERARLDRLAQVISFPRPFPRELTDCIIDHLAAEEKGTALLKTCSVVSQSFRSRCRHHLFSTLYLSISTMPVAYKLLQRYIELPKFFPPTLATVKQIITNFDDDEGYAPVSQDRRFPDRLDYFPSLQHLILINLRCTHGDVSFPNPEYESDTEEECWEDDVAGSAPMGHLLTESPHVFPKLTVFRDEFPVFGDLCAIMTNSPKLQDVQFLTVSGNISGRPCKSPHSWDHVETLTIDCTVSGPKEQPSRSILQSITTPGVCPTSLPRLEKLTVLIDNDWWKDIETLLTMTSATLRSLTLVFPDPREDDSVKDLPNFATVEDLCLDFVHSVKTTGRFYYADELEGRLSTQLTNWRSQMLLALQKQTSYALSTLRLRFLRGSDSFEEIWTSLSELLVKEKPRKFPNLFLIHLDFVSREEKIQRVEGKSAWLEKLETVGIRVELNVLKESEWSLVDIPGRILKKAPQWY